MTPTGRILNAGPLRSGIPQDLLLPLRNATHGDGQVTRPAAAAHARARIPEPTTSSRRSVDALESPKPAITRKCAMPSQQKGQITKVYAPKGLLPASTAAKHPRNRCLLPPP
ncbi:unnamed protein product [Parascedosporium putredinis]|uniref:Uncharacterized protein n=1 Tax=Parascedosporium putredinis TaxID=1442378 RepID=A0A9P1M7Y0_9PEZI|nr:unnamed protein product [Parascedosporium putredinis]CAI7988821.1 unnamed protein product [Parascedosporium putredinis]